MGAEARLAQRLEELGRVSDEPGRLTRTFLSPAMRRANRLVGGWMAEAGLAVREDAVGNLIGRLDSPRRPAPTFLLGSHLDTVRDAGRFDGALGVLVALAAAEELRRSGETLPFHLELLGFSEEEGVRFAGAYLGSKGYCGLLEAADLDLADGEGITVRQALAGLPGGAGPESPPELLGYLEVHIEQGPVLEAEGLALGVVSAIAGQSRFRLTWTGTAGHAGTTPMRLRRDAFGGAAEFALAAERLARQSEDLVATVGTLEISPGAPNVIPGEAVHTLDLRHPDDAARGRALAALRTAAARIAGERGLAVQWTRTQDQNAVACSPALTDLLAESVGSRQGRCLRLPSGAGHDAVILSRVTEVAMLFVRCRGGLSHHPDEFAAPEDVAAALQAVLDFLRRLGARA